MHVNWEYIYIGTYIYGYIQIVYSYVLGLAALFAHSATKLIYKSNKTN